MHVEVSAVAIDAFDRSGRLYTGRQRRKGSVPPSVWVMVIAPSGKDRGLKGFALASDEGTGVLRSSGPVAAVVPDPFLCLAFS